MSRVFFCNVLCLTNITKGVERLKAVKAILSSENPKWAPASKCIDGDSETTSIGNLCHTYEPFPRAPWLALDYGTLVTVKRVELFNRADCCGDRTRNVDIRVSNELPPSDTQMFFRGQLLGHFPGPASDGQHIVIQG